MSTHRPPADCDPTNTVYVGVRYSDGELRITADAKALDPADSQSVWNHSPDGFNWGYGGAGPRLLARGILYEVCEDAEVAIQLEQRYKWDVVARLSRQWWQLGAVEVEAWIIARIAEFHPDQVIDLGDCGEAQS